MPEINTIVNVQITRQTITATRKGFGTALIFSKSANFLDVRNYTSLTALANDFLTSSETYKLANSIFAQSPRPEFIQVAKWDILNSLTDELNTLVNKENGNAWYFIILDTPSEQDIKDGASWIETRNQLLAYQTEDPNVLLPGFTTDIASFLQDQNYDRTFGFHNQPGQKEIQEITFSGPLITGNNIDGEVNGVAITTVPFNTSSAQTLTDLATVLQALTSVFTATTGANKVIVTSELSQTSILTSFIVTGGVSQATVTIVQTQIPIIASIGNKLHSAIIGRLAPEDPGSVNWAFKSLAGEGASHYTDTEFNTVEDKSANVYVKIGGIDQTRLGVVASGEYIDIMIGTDFIQARIEEGIVTLLNTAKKIPYTNEGITAISNQVEKVLKQATDQGILSPERPYVITQTLAEDQPQADRVAREFNGLSFVAYYSGAINKVKIIGTISI